mgnify:CR=1 FL=1
MTLSVLYELLNIIRHIEMSCELLNASLGTPLFLKFTVVIGIALSKTKETTMLNYGLKTWIRPRAWMSYLMLIPCNKNFTIPKFIESRCTLNSIWNYHTGNYMVLAELLETMYSTLPRHDFYLKIDTDTLVVPSNLALFLTKFPQVQYFGSTDVTYKNVKVLGIKNRFNYIQGGFEGYSYNSIQTIVNDKCIAKVGYPNCSTTYCLNKRDDISGGACAFLNDIKLTHCKCFFPWGPCDIYNPSSCTGRICANTISIHKLKKKDWYFKWWNILTNIS